MATPQRALGQDTTLELLKGAGGKVKQIKVLSWTVTHSLELKSQGYVGDHTDQKDSIYKGEKGTCKLHITSDDLLTLADDLVLRAKREMPHFEINVMSTIKFPGIGKKRRTLYSDVFFGDIPTNISGRDAYVDVDLTWECSDYKKM